MAVFRVQKTQNYTIMSNHHLRNKALSLKAKGLLSLMLSLPEDWDYTTRGLASICKEGVDSVCATVREFGSGGVYYPPPHPRQERSDARYGVHGFRAAAIPRTGSRRSCA